MFLSSTGGINRDDPAQGASEFLRELLGATPRVFTQVTVEP
jgi:hypothetical protein